MNFLNITGICEDASTVANYYMNKTRDFAEPYVEVAFNGKLAEVASEFFKVNIHENIYLNSGAVILGSGLIGKSMALITANGLSLRNVTITAIGAGILIAGAVNGTNTNDEFYMNITLAFLGASASAALSRIQHTKSPKIDTPIKQEIQNQITSDTNNTVINHPLVETPDSDKTNPQPGPYSGIVSDQ